jgi:hypothetical protein
VRGFARAYFITARFRLKSRNGKCNFEYQIQTMIQPQNINWDVVKDSLNSKGYARLPNLVSEAECDSFQSQYGVESLYRSTIDMQRYRFGKGEYKYFKYPLPEKIQSLRETLYTPLSEVANEWMRQLQIDISYPADHRDLISHCHQQNQRRPTPLILQYQEGGFNTLHQDLYGDVYFPFQVVFALSKQGADYEGGEFVLVEQLPRAQSRARVLYLNQGDALIFTTNFRPVKGTKGYYRAKMKHGISEVTSGRRYALGIIFHDAS